MIVHSKDRIEQAIVVVTVPERWRKKVEGVFRWLLGPVQSQPGLVRCDFNVELFDRRRLSFITRWRSREHLEGFLRSEFFTAVLAVAELGDEAPLIRFETLCDPRGLDYIGQIRRRCADDV
jgi:quinol monooxygenase YgiN